jgi:1-acyl-sn-glycerol-3-phosphate acyltransferase
VRDGQCELTPATPSPRVQRVFAWYAERLLRRRFAAVRYAPGSEAALEAAASADAPILLVMSHASWWDPIVGAFLWRRWMPTRAAFAPMDAHELNRFRFMRKLGLFGIDPDDPRSLPVMVDYLRARVAESPRTLLAITPQGRFTDPRSPLVVRPGAAAVAARLAVRHAIAVAVEYAFWSDQKPEVFLRATPIAPPITPPVDAGPGVRGSSRVGDWHEAISGTMARNGEALASLVVAREPAAFTDALRSKASIHPVYDLWLSMTGRGRSIDASRRSVPVPAAATNSTPNTTPIAGGSR